MNKTIRLLKDHLHSGAKYRPGAVLTLRTKEADWLIGLGVGKEVVTETPNSLTRVPPIKSGGCRGCGRPW